MALKASNPSSTEDETEAPRRGVESPKVTQKPARWGLCHMEPSRNSSPSRVGWDTATQVSFCLHTWAERAHPRRVLGAGGGGWGLVWPLAPDTRSCLSVLSAPTLVKPRLPSPGPSLQPLDGTLPLYLHPLPSHKPPEAHLGSHPSPPQTPSMAPQCPGTKLSSAAQATAQTPGLCAIPSAWRSPYRGRRR